MGHVVGGNVSIWRAQAIMSLQIGELVSQVIRNPVYVIYEQQRRRSACAFAQSDQRLCFIAAWIALYLYLLQPKFQDSS